MDFLHSSLIFHRDVKDENILIDDDLNVKLIDFGSAIILQERNESMTKFLGTKQYAPCEILKGEPYFAEPAEIWTLGCCLYVMLTGKVPYDSAHHGMNSPFKTLPSHLSDECVDILNIMLIKNPDERATLHQVMNHEWMKNSV